MAIKILQKSVKTVIKDDLKRIFTPKRKRFLRCFRDKIRHKSFGKRGFRVRKKSPEVVQGIQDNDAQTRTMAFERQDQSPESTVSINLLGRLLVKLLALFSLCSDNVYCPSLLSSILPLLFYPFSILVCVYLCL